MALLAQGIKHGRSNEILHPGQKALELVENLSTAQSEFEAIRRSNQKIILEHCACAPEGPAHSRLADEQAGCSGRNAFFLCDRANIMRRFKSTWRSFSIRMAILTIMHKRMR
jgi:hypothetical protein